MVKVHAEFDQAGMQPGGAIDEAFGVVDGMFVLQLSQNIFVNAVVLEG
jgi:hypothetical protein